MYRSKPFWYSQQLPEVATQFSGCFSSGRPPNLHILPSFINQDFLHDGVSLTPVAGLHFVLHLFDQSEAVLALAEADLAQKAQVSQETSRYHDDRIAYLEHGQGEVSGRLRRKIAIDAEFADWVLNRSEEDWFTIRGLPRLGSLSQQDWQVEAKRQVKDVIRLILQLNKVQNLNIDVLLVVNPLRKRLTGPTLYNVRVNSVYACTRLKEIFSGFFRRVNPVKKPASLKTISIRNKITHDTAIRIAIMRQLGENYQSHNQGSSYKVKGYDPRPLLTIFPPPKSSHPRPQTMNFIQAVSNLPSHFSDENLIQIFSVVGESDRGKLRELFVVLNDDDHDRCSDLVKKYYEGRRQDPRSSRRGVASAEASSHSGVVRGPGSGMEQESSVLRSLALPPPPPPPQTLEKPSRVDKKRRRSESASSSSSHEKSRKSVKFSRSSKSGKSSKSRRKHKSKKSKKRSTRSSSSSSSSSGSGSGSDSDSSSSDSSGSAHRSHKK